MVRTPCCSKVGLHKGAWSLKEDKLLTRYIQEHGEGKWNSLPTKAGLLRCGKSCRLRWKNYLRPDIKRGNITTDEDDLILRLHSLLGNRWSLIARSLPGRTDNEIKNHWNTHLHKSLSGIQDKKNKENVAESTQISLTEPSNSVSNSVDISCTVSGSSSTHHVDDDNGVSWPFFDFVEASELEGDDLHQHLLMSGCDLSFQCTLPADDNCKLFDDYLQQLLN